MFRLETASMLGALLVPLWELRRQIDHGIAGGLVAFERGFFEGVEIMELMMQQPKQSSEFADWEG